MLDAPLIRLDSSRPRETRWPLPPTVARGAILRCDSSTFCATLRKGREPAACWRDPLEALDWLGKQADGEPGRSRWTGFLSYDLGRLFEALPSRAEDDLGIPAFEFALCRESDEARRGGADRPMDSGLGMARAAPKSTFTPSGYRAAVSRVIDYIRAGDIFQANLAQRFTLPCTATPASIYENLLRAAPASHGGLLDFGDYALVCNSPELFLRVTPDPRTGRRRIITRPIKGTRPLLPGMDVELRNSVKDQAELNMIVDLERNDLGRICEIGSVKVTEPRVIEPHPTLYHGAATIEGTLRADVTFVDILRATFPGGSITGAPKIRAMEIIDELEPVRRGAYCGAIGYLGPGGEMEFNVAIRTMIVKDGLAHISVGGGIVADSDPDEEYEETLVKARAMCAALGVSPDALR